MKQILTLLIIVLGILHSPGNLFAGQITVTHAPGSGNFPLVKSGAASYMLVDSLDAEVVTIAAIALSADIKLITDIAPVVGNTIEGEYLVIIGTLGKSVFIDSLVKTGKISTSNVEGKWETFGLTVVDSPFEGVNQALVIYGSDPRGTAFGIFELSHLMGVSPMVWWADVFPEKHDEIYITAGESIVGPPSVQYRGIFINDEDWGLQPWAANNFDPVKDIGPKTYEKVFELLLRVKANYIWPAMHPSTHSFNYFPENKVVAGKYAIVMGSSHHEPLLYNTIKDWPYAASAWNPYTNLPTIMAELEKRVIANGQYENMYSLCMRGAGDSAMPGTLNEQTAKLQECIGLQRDLLAKHIDPDITAVPQVLFPYKEVLNQYNNGLVVPDDVTLGWVDDNFGYIRQLSNPKEQLRSGGSGVYYHFSYWGKPDDYLWLSSTSPSLTSFEMMKAYALNAKKLWIFNVGDIKPQEMELQFAMDLAWDVNTWTPEKAHLYSAHWAAETFGDGFGESIGAIKQEYFRLAASGKPEHLASISYSEQEILQRLAAYDSLVVECNKVKAQIPSRLKDAYFQLIEYPVKGAASMNTKELAARLSHTYSGQGNDEALVFSAKAVKAFENITTLTRQYNKDISGGKWDGIMDYAPRGLSRFYAPNVASVVNKSDLPPAVEDIVHVIPATNYTDLSNSALKTIDGLGDQGGALSVWPLDMTSYSASNVTSAPYAEYTIQVEKGANKISVRCLPTFPLYTALQLRYAISIDGSATQFVNIEASAESATWSKNVLQGYASGETSYLSDSDKTVKVRVYFTDPGLVVSAVASAAVYENELTARLKNPNFEYKSEGVFNDGTTVRGIPYGWEYTGTLKGNSFGINSDGSNYSGNNLCWINSTPMPDKFELYQVIDDLPAGEYIVRCRLAAMSTTITNERLFANENVQYFGSESIYQSNLTAGEINTFAGHTPSTSYNLKEMAVKVSIFAGDSLKVGIRSSNKKSNGTAASDNSGWFKVDHFRIENIKLFSGISDEKSILDSLINVAQDVYNSTQAGINAGEYPEENRTLFNTSIQSAQTVLSNNKATLEDVLTEISSLQIAIKAYNDSAITFNSKLSNPDFEYSSEGVLNDGSTVRGIPYGWNSKGELAGNSFGINNDGVNYNGSNLCWILASPMPDEYELYQTVENLPAGEYMVQCRLAVMSDLVTNQRLFANNSVQYFGLETDYVSNLTEGEKNTFAGWIPAVTYNLKEMEVTVEITEGEPLQLGIRSGNQYSDGSRESSTSAGWFKVDHFRIEQISTPGNNIELTQKPNVRIFNTSGGFEVKINDVIRQGEIKLYSIAGRLVLQERLFNNKTIVSVSQPGIYIAKLLVNGVYTTKKIMIN
ncbi:MAG: glycosyl hydrolase 115 family protein [Prolixibacteraceae bacterium]